MAPTIAIRVGRETRPTGTAPRARPVRPAARRDRRSSSPAARRAQRCADPAPSRPASD